LLFLTENYRQRLANQVFEPVAFIKPIDSIDRPLGLCRLVAEIDQGRNRIVDSLPK
jgi:hypothetical protein